MLKSKWLGCEQHNILLKDYLATQRLTEQDWTSAFANFGGTPQQSLSFVKALYQSSNSQTPIMLSDGSAVSIFRREGEVAICEMAGAGIMPLTSNKVDIGTYFEWAKQILDVEVLYFAL